MTEPRLSRSARAGIMTLLSGSCLAMAAPAPADPATPLTAHFGRGDSCYARVYSAQHLAEHPEQKTLEIRLDHFPDYEGFEDDQGRKLFYPDTPEIVVNLAVRTRASGGIMTATGFCWPDKARPDTMSCGLECDAGQFTLRGRGKGKILLTLSGTLYFGEGCGDDAELAPEPDDRSFLLARQPDAVCHPPE